MASHWPAAVISWSLSRAWIQSPAWARLPSLSLTRSRPGRHPAALPGLGHVLGGLPVQLGDLGLRLGDHQRVPARPDGGGPVQHHVPPGLVLTSGVNATPGLVVRDHGDVTVPEPE